MTDLRFGISLATPGSHDDLVRTCQTAEAHGFDTVVAVDHLGPNRTSPFQVLLAAAHASDRLTVGTYVLNTAFWNPWMLAREVQTIQRLTGNRLELGLGAGIIKQEFDAAGIPWRPMDDRMAHLRSTLDELAALLGPEEGVRAPRTLIGGTGDRALTFAARHADIVSIGGILHVKGKATGNFRIIDAAETDGRVALVRAAAGDRDVELNSFVQVVELTDDRTAAAERIAADWELPVEVVLDSPFVLLGTEHEIAAQVAANHRRYGFTAVYVQRPYLDALGPAIKIARSLV
ncbi:TIGR03621 family F420-dependent LLM class oxidoreductase [Saccharothrix hoggarensis]|uniref:TIGR03621 family F420-dependent LLM class oxidoreductase n=1 Tax=Saccharothrix hoggarensis TaxID=913853 RepID=A0ABW3QPI1_9PSEU